MNISEAARKALIPIEKEIMSQKTEHACQFDNNGKLLSHSEGTNKKVIIRFVKKGAILTHNHPGCSVKNTSLSPSDLLWAVKAECREFRAVTKDRFCYLVEVPELKQSEKLRCIGILAAYKYLNKKKGVFMSLYREVRKELEKAAGLKFRTIKLPK